MERKIKHLEFIQTNIERMSKNSFLIKGWGLTLVVALLTVAEKNTNARYVLIAYATTLVFWLLDGYFLSQERLFRALYNEIRTRSEENIDFSMDIKHLCNGNCTWVSSIFSNTLLIFYLSISLIMLAIAYLLK